MPLGDRFDFLSRVSTMDVTIPAASSISDGVRLGGASLVGLIMPAAWDAADMTFEVSMDGTTYVPMFTNAGGIYTVTAGVGRYIVLPPLDFAGPYYVRVRSGTPALPVNQIAARTITLVGKAIS